MKVLRSDDGAARTLTLNRPEVRNALDTELLEALLSELRAAVADPGVRCLLLTGAGKGFCAGADVKAWVEEGPEADAGPRPGSKLRPRARDRAGGGAAPDRRAPERGRRRRRPRSRARLRLPDRGRGGPLRLRLHVDGLPARRGRTWLLPRVIGLERAKRFVYTGELWDAGTALANGLVSRVVPLDGLAAAGAEAAAERRERADRRDRAREAAARLRPPAHARRAASRGGRRGSGLLPH